VQRRGEARHPDAAASCTLPGYQPGYVELVFDGETEVTICMMKRLPCVPGIKDPFQDCPE
jgi:hypothetical protein